MTATVQTRFYGTRSIVNPDNGEHAAMGRVDFEPRPTFEQQRVRLIGYVTREALSEYSSDEVRERCLQLVRQLSELDEPMEEGYVRVEAGGVRLTIRRQG